MSQPNIDPLDELIENPNGGLMTPEQVEDMLAGQELSEDELYDLRAEAAVEREWHERGYSPDEHIDREFEDRISGYDYETSDL